MLGGNRGRRNITPRLQYRSVSMRDAEDEEDGTAAGEILPGRRVMNHLAHRFVATTLRQPVVYAARADTLADGGMQRRPSVGELSLAQPRGGDKNGRDDDDGGGDRVRTQASSPSSSYNRRQLFQHYQWRSMGQAESSPSSVLSSNNNTTFHHHHHGGQKPGNFGPPNGSVGGGGGCKKKLSAHHYQRQPPWDDQLTGSGSQLSNSFSVSFDGHHHHRDGDEDDPFRTPIDQPQQPNRLAAPGTTMVVQQKSVSITFGASLAAASNTAAMDHYHKMGAGEERTTQRRNFSSTRTANEVRSGSNYAQKQKYRQFSQDKSPSRARVYHNRSPTVGGGDGNAALLMVHTDSTTSEPSSSAGHRVSASATSSPSHHFYQQQRNKGGGGSGRHLPTCGSGASSSLNNSLDVDELSGSEGGSRRASPEVNGRQQRGQHHQHQKHATTARLAVSDGGSDGSSPMASTSPLPTQGATASSGARNNPPPHSQRITAGAASRRSTAVTNSGASDSSMISASAQQIITYCMENARGNIAGRVLTRMAHKREDFAKFCANMTPEQFRQFLDQFRTYLTDVVRSLQNADRIREVSREFGGEQVSRRSFGFKADFFAIMADALTTECVFLDGATHQPTDAIEAWSELVELMFTNIRDGYYQQIRLMRRSNAQASQSFGGGQSSDHSIDLPSTANGDVGELGSLVQQSLSGCGGDRSPSTRKVLGGGGGCGPVEATMEYYA